MYVVTYYSFKGGVGRTMAVVNTAFVLAARQKNVLIVDFDLEAPGLSTYDFSHHAGETPGIVDYVVRYLETAESPDVRDYLMECKLHRDDLQSVWIMPAGKRDASYAQKLASIDWANIYQEHHGYLLLEDLKQQWANHTKPKFDYVLIDSRTGHTDVGGICTRHLPDAVVLMFFPNAQNINGMASVVNEIRSENQRRRDGNLRSKEISLLFCPSNVPELDDEEEILRTQLKEAETVLGYSRPASTIRHYNSLDLLRQAIFVSERPRTRLAEEYRILTKAVVQRNLEDKEGALSTLESVKKNLKIYRREVSSQELREAANHDASLRRIADQINRIRENHPQDGEIAWELASVYRSMGDLQSESDALSTAIERNFNATEARRLRAVNLLKQGRREEAIIDLRSVISSEDAAPLDVSAAVDMLRRHDPEWIGVIEKAQSISRLRPEDRIQVADKLTVNEKGSQLAADIAREVLKEDGAGTRDEARSTLVLSLIGTGHFGDALRIISESRERVLDSNDIGDVFNYSMAEWGERRQPPKDLLRRALELDATGKGADGSNYNQCIGLAYAVLNKSAEAVQRLNRARNLLGPGDVFSCWRYLKVSSREMAKDLDELERQALDSEVHPPFLDRKMLERLER